MNTEHVEAARSGAVGTDPTAAAPDPLGQLWQRLSEHGVTGIERQALQGRPVFDTDALVYILNRRGTIGPPNSWPVLDFVCSLRRPDAWEGLVTIGQEPSDPLTAWVMLYGPRHPDRIPAQSLYDRPHLLMLLSGYSALRHTCESAQLLVSPMQYDGQSRQWLGARTERLVLGYGSAAPDRLRPPDDEERTALRGLARAICDVLPLPPGVYRSEYSER